MDGVCSPNLQTVKEGGQDYFNDLVQDCSNSSALAMELLQSCTKPSTCCA